MADDRTFEFRSLAQSLPPPPPPAVSAAAASSLTAAALSSTTTTAGPIMGRYGSSNGPVYEELRVFHKTAADISRDIAATSALLSQLAQSVRQDSLFDSDSHNINRLVIQIKANIENLNSRLDQASLTLRDKKQRLNSQAGQEATNLVSQLKQEFVTATTGFKSILQQRTDVMRETTERKKLVYGSYNQHDQQQQAAKLPQLSLDSKPPVYSSAPNSTAAGMQQFPTLDLTSGIIMSAGESTSSTPTLPRPHGVAGHGGGSAYSVPYQHTNSMPTYSGGQSSFHEGSTMITTPLTPLDIQRMEQESSQMTLLIPDQSYLRERADAMEQVESNIVELGTIFNKLAVMVGEHREMVQRVEDNVDQTESNVNLSMQVLSDTLTSLRTNRAVAMKVFAIMVLFIIFFIIFFA